MPGQQTSLYHSITFGHVGGIDGKKNSPVLFQYSTIRRKGALSMSDNAQYKNNNTKTSCYLFPIILVLACSHLRVDTCFLSHRNRVDLSSPLLYLLLLLFLLHTTLHTTVPQGYHTMYSPVSGLHRGKCQPKHDGRTCSII